MAEATIMDSSSKYPALNDNYHGLIDIGSNGVRFSISDLTPPTTRVMPTLYQDRAAISLYDAQFAGTTKGPIPAEIINSIVSALVRFKHICATFGVPPSQIRAVATEATREAQNSQYFRNRIHTATGWTVELLSKSDEGRIGAWGVASSLVEVAGLVMDLGGGSTQLSWMISPGRDGVTQISETPISLPYGAAALTKRLETAINDAAKADIKAEMATRLAEAYTAVGLPDTLLENATLYLSGGGFRGFGYLLMSQHEISPYPIPIINGFAVPASAMWSLASSPLTDDTVSALKSTFRISARRARQIPAVALLISTLCHTLPAITTVVFCQGGVREGALYSLLPPTTHGLDPLTVATSPFAPPSAAVFAQLLSHSLPRSAPWAIRTLIPALANMITHHANVPKESRASCGVHTTTTGALAGVHGLAHSVRALLALALCARWGGEVSDTTLKHRLSILVGGEMEFWARYIGAVAGLVGAVYPAGLVVEGEERIRVYGEDAGGEEGGFVLRVRFVRGDDVTGVMVEDDVEAIGKVGKNKKCLYGYRRKVQTLVTRDL
ncbi:Ppx/GppA phosphatase family-domain-containing protein [Geopyxis carbonaria]|nr:Ppx/GppA phosphatase family-domain-containing protein [Geopyxis carbonaria]